MVEAQGLASHLRSAWCMWALVVTLREALVAMLVEIEARANPPDPDPFRPLAAEIRPLPHQVSHNRICRRKGLPGKASGPFAAVWWSIRW